MSKHEFIGGITRSGKTYYALKKIEREKEKALIIDIKAEVRKGKILTDANNLKELIYSIKNYKVVTFYPTNDIEIAKTQIDLILDTLIKLKTQINLNVYIDEIQDFIPQNTQNSAIYRVARRGLQSTNKGIQLKLIGQSPSDIDKRALKQVEKITLFRLNDWSYKYLQSKGLPHDEIKDMLTKAKEYSRVEIENGKVNLFGPV